MEEKLNIDMDVEAMDIIHSDKGNLSLIKTYPSLRTLDLLRNILLNIWRWEILYFSSSKKGITPSV